MPVTRQRHGGAQVLLHGRVPGPEAAFHGAAKAALVIGIHGDTTACPFGRREPELTRVVVHAMDADDDVLWFGDAFGGPDAQSKPGSIMAFHHAFAIQKGGHGVAQQAAGAVLTEAHRLHAWRNGHSPSPLGKAALGSFMKAR